ncbi:putative phage abortive infection protein [Lactococcus lactis]|uniref:Phage abortive infection protein n=1 Tax=Lactococcus lactis TaxID=1358 RepID=A0AAW8UH27_9LACT|nr:putative phage abortive infection protein [Lactococcus lactis]MDT2880329.1 putative phage abortive infection protein [Lactococcus lactis]MDT2945377.1 putative phage abortive infection protein [Lactococcus lactis]MDT2947543.1 putative phage abortive infection protein [Lactococcus lactis]
MYKKNKKNEVIDWSPWIIFGIVVAVIIVIAVINLPLLAKGYTHMVHNKANPSQMNLSRSEFLKILISLISPILSFIVLKNTVTIQRVSLERKNIDDVNRDFYGLVDIFSKQQNKIKNLVSEFHRNVIVREGLTNRFNRGYLLSDFDPEESSYSYLYFFKGKHDIQNWITKSITEDIRNKDKDYRVDYIINEQFDSVYYEVSSYFKVLHRIIKNLNKKFEEKIIDEELYLNYIGILRAQIDSEELVMILVNSLYTYRGLGLAIELVGTDFFGDKRDFELEQHFKFPAPQIKSEDVGIFAYDKSGKMKDKRIELRKTLKNNTSTSDLQLSSSKSNFIKFSKENEKDD